MLEKILKNLCRKDYMIIL